ncbi:hypothetical protein BLTE_10850 [Blastochloris tepida]|uniref:Uncharacterized protein n=1 Tax=Blastochloris tepida TaxID=2233851 RepID=A0A348FYL7_9HYPH|nr:hypothetical protein BLTE_10850 [Blastochloris tepida]
MTRPVSTVRASVDTPSDPRAAAPRRRETRHLRKWWGGGATRDLQQTSSAHLPAGARLPPRAPAGPLAGPKATRFAL